MIRIKRQSDPQLTNAMFLPYVQLSAVIRGMKRAIVIESSKPPTENEYWQFMAQGVVEPVNVVTTWVEPIDRLPPKLLRHFKKRRRYVVHFKLTE